MLGDIVGMEVFCLGLKAKGSGKLGTAWHTDFVFYFV